MFTLIPIFAIAFVVALTTLLAILPDEGISQ